MNEKDDDRKVHDSTGNVFADLGLPTAEEDLAKAQVALAIARTIKERGLTQVQAAKLAGLTQARISDIGRGKLTGFTLDRLLLVLSSLGRDVSIKIEKSVRKDRGKIRVYA
jgi:predicted XRE-type DNA-binding protein